MPIDHTIRGGENVMLLAQQEGLFWQTVWNHPKNAALKSLRKDPDVLLPGDILHIPDKAEKQASGSTEQKHRFRVKGTPAKFVLKLVHSEPSEDPAEVVSNDDWQFSDPEPAAEENEPRADVPYHLFADDVLVAEGNTDADGKLEARVPPTARSGRLVLYPGTSQEQTLILNWAHMDPISETVGVCKRLNNLGYRCPADAAEDSPEFQAALAAFQRHEGLDVTGRLDDTIRSKLQDAYGG